MRQKIIVGILCLALTLSIAGCGGQSTQEPKQEIQQVEPAIIMEPKTPEVKSADSIADVESEDVKPKEQEKEIDKLEGIDKLLA